MWLPSSVKIAPMDAQIASLYYIPKYWNLYNLVWESVVAGLLFDLY
jgi:hypothetical protein